MRKKLFVALLLVFVFAGISYISAVACDKKGASCAFELPKKIKLTKEQKSKFEEISMECDKAGEKTHADIKAVRSGLHALLKKDPADKAAVDAKVDEIADLIKKALKDRMDCKVKILSILDAEQKKAYLESMDSHCTYGGHHDCGWKNGHGGCDTKEKKPCGMKDMGASENM